MSFPLIERYRAELRAMPLPRLDDAQLADMRRRDAHAHHSSAIEDVHPSPELAALFDLFLEERVPAEVSRAFVTRFFDDRDERQAARRVG